MLRKLALAAIVAVGGLVGSASIPAPAHAQGIYLGMNGPGYDRYERPRRYRSYERDRYDDRYEGRRSYSRGYGRGRNCGVETQRYWNGYKYAKRRVPVCYR